MRSVRVLYFAGVRDFVGRSEEPISLPEGVRTVGELAALLGRTHPGLGDRLGSVRFAVNEAFATLDAEVAEGDTIALIPPVSGG